MKIVVVGCNGQVGRALIHRGGSHGFKMLGISKETLNITSKKMVYDVLHSQKPNLLINAAAYTKVDLAEKEVDKAFEINEKALFYLSEYCKTSNIPLFHLSTDYVFDGKINYPYKELDSVSPISVYGKSKEAGECAVRKLLVQHIILRTSWVFSAHGSNFVKSILSKGIEQDIINVVTDQYGGPTSADGIADTLLTIASQYNLIGKLEWGTYHYSGYPYVSWYEFAEEIFRSALAINIVKKIPTIKPLLSSAHSATASRPRNSRLDCSKIYKNFGISMDNWKVRLLNFLETY